MGAISQPEPVTLIVGMLSRFPELFDLVEPQLEAKYGKTELRSAVFDFDFTRYYEGEMGTDIRRRFISFEDLIDPGEIADIKIWTNGLEDEVAQRGAHPATRPINLDPGYITRTKLALATTKDYGHRIYIARGIYAESTLRYLKGTFAPWPWTYPDYRTEEYVKFFQDVRLAHIQRLKTNDV